MATVNGITHLKFVSKVRGTCSVKTFAPVVLDQASLHEYRIHEHHFVLGCGNGTVFRAGVRYSGYKFHWYTECLQYAIPAVASWSKVVTVNHMRIAIKLSSWLML